MSIDRGGGARLSERIVCAAPPVALMRVDVLGAPLPGATPYWLLDRIDVDSGARIIAFEFATLDFTSPALNMMLSHQDD